MVMGTDRTLATQLQSPPGASPLQGPNQHRWAHVCMWLWQVHGHGHGDARCRGAPKDARCSHHP